MILDESVRLSNGVLMPKLGLETWHVDHDRARELSRGAVEIGYHLINAQSECERAVFEGMHDTRIPRNLMFITVNLSSNSYKEASADITRTLQELNTEYIDLLIMNNNEHNLEVYQAFEDAYAQGKARAIGVSCIDQIELCEILNECDTTPMVHQIPCSICYTPFACIEACSRHRIVLQSTCPVTCKPDAKIEEIAHKYGVCVAQLCIRYVLQLGLCALIETQTLRHLQQCADVDFTIYDQDMDILARLNTAPVVSYA